MSIANPKTIIVTGASQGIGASLATAFVERGYNVVANARNFTGSAITSNGKLVVVEGNIGKASARLSCKYKDIKVNYNAFKTHDNFGGRPRFFG